MLEPNLFKKKSNASGVGISIPGFTGTPTASAGVSQTNGAYSFAGAGVVDYLRIPYANTPSPSSEDCQVTCRFIANSISTQLDMFSRYIQGNDAPSWMVIVTAGKVVEFVYNNLVQATTGSIVMGVEQKIVFKRQGSVYTITLNDVVVMSLTYAGTRTSTWDWVIGSYLNGSNQVIGATYAFPCNWQLLEFTVIRL